MGVAQQVYHTVTIETETCFQCGCVFGMSSEFRRHRLDKHDTFYCPAGHSQHYIGKSEAQKLREELDAERDRKLSALARANEAEAREAKVLRKLKRVSRGVCPECNRSFDNLARHMACKHAPTTP
jgi:hypothetical protein